MPTFENRQALKQAMISYHGEDMEGKDGSLAAVGFDTALVYHEYQSYKCSNNSDVNNFEPKSVTNSGMSFVNGRFVVGDVSARETATVEKLANDLKAIGVEVTAGSIEGINSNIVSAKIPIDKLPAVAQLDSVRSFIPARATTNTGSGNVINTDPHTNSQNNKNIISTVPYGSANSSGFDFSAGSTVDNSTGNADISYYRECDAETVEDDPEKSCHIRVEVSDSTNIVRNTASCKEYESDIKTSVLEKYGFDLSQNDVVCLETKDDKTYKLKATEKASGEGFSLTWIEY
jgi:hypothetical protein